MPTRSEPKYNLADLMSLSTELARALERMNGRMDVFDERMAHLEELLGARLEDIETKQADQEERLRQASEGVVRLTTSLSLLQAGQAVFTLVLSTLAAWLGQR